MAIPPRFARSHRLGAANSKHTLEFFLDYICPFSGKQWKGINESLLPLLKDGQASVVFRHQVQPWHSSSTLVHEAALAVATVAPEKFWSFSTLLFERQSAFYDEACALESPRATRERLAALAEDVKVDKSAVLDLIYIAKGASNGGNKVTNDLKQTIKYSRQNSIHVSPTVLLDGVIDPSISSSFTKEDWQQYVKEKLN